MSVGKATRPTAAISTVVSVVESPDYMDTDNQRPNVGPLTEGGDVHTDGGGTSASSSMCTCTCARLRKTED
jgi:hypothetical protein